MDKTPLQNYLKRGFPNFVAASLVVLSAILFVTAWLTPNWLQWRIGDGTSIFDKMGLWLKCNHNRDRSWAATSYYPGYFENPPEDCAWIILSNKFSANLIAIQILFTFSTLIILVMAFIVGICTCCKKPENGKRFLMITSIMTIISGFLALVSIIMFGVMVYDNRNSEYYLSWSFYLAVFGIVAEFIAGFLYLNLIRTYDTQGLGYAVAYTSNGNH